MPQARPNHSSSVGGAGKLIPSATQAAKEKAAREAARANALQIKQLQQQALTKLTQCKLHIGLYLRSDPPSANDFHWSFYYHKNTSGGTKYHVKTLSSGWIPDHSVTSGIFKSNFLCVLIQIASIPADKEQQLDQVMRRYDGNLNGIPNITCRVWVMNILALLVQQGLAPRLQFNVHDFIHEDATTGDAFITTAELPRYAWYLNGLHWADKPELPIPSGGGWLIDIAEEWLGDLDKCLQFTAGAVNSFADLLDPSRASIKDFDIALARTVLLSIAFLAEYIHSVRENVFRFKPPTKLTFRPRILDQDLLRAGWCQGEISGFISDCNLTCRYFLKQIDRNVLRKDHSRCNEADGCQADQILNYDGIPAHFRDCGLGRRDCREIGPIPEDIINVLEQGGIPVIITCVDMMKDDAQPAQVHVIQTKDVPSYVAISHVWSDGLGNPKANQRNSCQLLSIQSCVNTLYPSTKIPVPFWIDTLCVPLVDVHPKHHALALDRMAETYRCADKALVLDNSLIQCNPDISTVELGLRLRYSPWMGRLWTLLEGRLANKIFFQFDGKAIDGEILQDVDAMSRNVLNANKSLDRMVQELGLGAVLQNPHSHKLIRALASQHQPRGQILDIPDEAEITNYQSDAEPLERSIAQKWFDILRRNELQDPAQLSADEDYFEALRTQVFDPITRHSLFAIQRVRGAGFQAILRAQRDVKADLRDPLRLSSHTTPADTFSDVVRGFRGRTTSRLEDETTCLGILTGADLSLLRNTKCMDWRVKDALNELLTKAGMRILFEHWEAF